MGLLNVLKGAWFGKVGETVGAKWKNKNTIHVYTKPSNPNTAAQQAVRTPFGQMAAFVALFADQIKFLTSLNTKSMSARNAIIRLNKEMISAGEFDKTALLVNKGGLPNVAGATLGTVSAADGVTLTWTAPTASSISAKAQLVAIVVDSVGKVAAVGSAKASAGTLTVKGAFTASNAADIYYYLLDPRNSYKAGSNSAHLAGTFA